MTLHTRHNKKDRVGRMIATTAVIVGLIVCLFLYYANWMSIKLRQIGTENVESAYSEVNALFNETATSRWRDLHFMYDYMRADATNYAERATIIQDYRGEIGFTYFYLLGDNGEYYSWRGGNGTFTYDDKCAEALQENEQSLIEAVLPSGEKIILFAIRIGEPIPYEGREYTAIGFAYNEHDMGEILKVDAFGEASYPYILGEDGVAVITSDRTTEATKVDNLLTFLQGATIIGDTYDDVATAFLNQETATYIIQVATGSYYLSFQPLGFQGYMLGSFTPCEAVDHSIDTVRLNTMAVIAIVVTLLFLLALFFIGVYYTRSIRHKNELIQAQEHSIENKDAELRDKNRLLAERNVQLEEALDAAESASQAKTAFLSNVSHDIRTPMNAIVGFSTLAEQDLSDQAKTSDYLHKIQISSQHLLNLINEVLDFSKIEAGKTTLRLESINIDTIVGRLDSMLRPQFLDRGQTFHVRNNSKVSCTVEADELRLSQVLINILSNANKYTPNGGTVEFCIDNAVDGEMVEYTFVIRDNGVGMSEEYLRQLYDPFTREVQSTTNKVAGTGLGMAITKNLVDLMAGTIEVESAQGVGTTFTIRTNFALVRVNEETVSEAKQDLSIAGLRILIAEDNELNAEIITELLAIEGCEVKVTENGRLCCKELWEQPARTYDAILMDVQMPEMNGYEATQAIRMSDHPDAREIPIIAMTANAFAEDKRDALDAGMNAHVPKPIDMKLLKRTLLEEIAARETVG